MRIAMLIRIRFRFSNTEFFCHQLTFFFLISYFRIRIRNSNSKLEFETRSAQLDGPDAQAHSEQVLRTLPQQEG